MSTIQVENVVNPPRTPIVSGSATNRMLFVCSETNHHPKSEGPDDVDNGDTHGKAARSPRNRCCDPPASNGAKATTERNQYCRQYPDASIRPCRAAVRPPSSEIVTYANPRIHAPDRNRSTVSTVNAENVVKEPRIPTPTKATTGVDHRAVWRTLSANQPRQSAPSRFTTSTGIVADHPTSTSISPTANRTDDPTTPPRKTAGAMWSGRAMKLGR